MEEKTKRISNGAIRRAKKAAIHSRICHEIEHERSTKKDNPVITNRMDRRLGLQQGTHEAMRKVKRTQRFMALKNEAAKIRKRFRKNFKKRERWVEIELEMRKLLGRKGESNFTPPKKKR